MDGHQGRQKVTIQTMNAPPAADPVQYTISQDQGAGNSAQAESNYALLIRKDFDLASLAAGENEPRRTNTSTHALQDYQMQLMLLEQQNKKRLMMARQGFETEVKATSDEETDEETAEEIDEKFDSGQRTVKEVDEEPNEIESHGESSPQVGKKRNYDGFGDDLDEPVVEGRTLLIEEHATATGEKETNFKRVKSSKDDPSTMMSPARKITVSHFTFFSLTS
ncbi:hypothetical protein B0H63DRAFT_315194 [Podospora didyma]|uniref:Uncharacterized protein n=1 Tax=Podospora didyma TaxID=330526 RepID=A0AAE0K662_9PEZI|nr:hypothetical protein B0H63DRAFT_315194 [Podospora didyma]